MRSLLLIALCAWPAVADVRLPAILSDHMVLQRDTRVPVWGWATPGEEVTVAIAGQSKATRAGADGRWRVMLDPLQPQAPTSMTVRASNTITVEDVLIGEVWLGSGQSNMAFVARNERSWETERGKVANRRIRLFHVETAYAVEPKEDCKGKWVVAEETTVARFSAVLFFFGRQLESTLQVPVGLINSSVGGTAIELWISKEAQQAPELKPSLDALAAVDARFDRTAAAARYQRQHEKWQREAADLRKQGKQPARAPVDPVAQHERKVALSALYNGMIAPLIPYALRGALWYQGEANSTEDRAAFYQLQLPALIRDWRTRWAQGEFPFGFVQLPNFNGPGRNWPVMREAFLKTLRVPNTGMAVTIDIGEADDIHPKNKLDVAARLSAWALGTVYGRKVEAVSSPLPDSFAFADGKATITVRHAGTGLMARGEPARGFEISADGTTWVPATASVAGNRITVTSPDVRTPVAVRYGWANNPECNVFSSAGFPLTPFRSRE